VESKAGAAVGAALASIGIVQNAAQTNGGLTWQSDEITYPKGTASASGTGELQCLEAHFDSPGGPMPDCNKKFVMKGNFGPQILANVRFELEETTTYYDSSLTFAAKALDTAFGTPDSPTVRFEVTGRFDPFGPGDVTYDAVLEVDMGGNVRCHSLHIVNGDGQLQDHSPQGFYLGI
jgi:hypothetical protein